MWLRVKVIGAAVICIGLPVLLGVAAAITVANLSLRQSAQSDLQAAANSAGTMIEERIAQNLAHLKAFAALPVMQDVLIDDNGGDIARVLSGMREAYGDFATLTVTDARGATVATTGKDARGTDLSADEGFRTAASGRAFQSAYGFRSASAPETIWFAVPLIAHYDRQSVIGTLIGVLDLKTVAKAVMARSALSATAKRMMVIESREDERIVYSSRIDASFLNALQVLKGVRSGAAEFSWRDETYFAAASATTGKGLLRDPGFIVHGIAPGSSVYAAANSIASWFGVIAGLVAALAVGLAWRWSTPLMRLDRAMGRLARGDVFVAIPEIAPQHAFGPMARALEVFRQTKVMRDRLTTRERELLRAKDDAETAAVVKAEHLASLTRELKAQLNAIVEISEHINRENLDAARGASPTRAKDIGRAAMQLLAVVNDLFDLSEAEAGRSVLEDADADLAEIVRDGVALMREAAQKAQIELTCDGCDAPVLVRVDSYKIKQVLFNLVSNAVKFTAEGGRVQVRLKVSSEGQPMITVQDNGIGMPVNLSPFALAPFSPDEATPHGRHGAGLGLPLARQLVHLHDGSLTIESEVGEGTIVTVALPASRLIPSLEDEERLIA